jgi:hypothetical protein
LPLVEEAEKEVVTTMVVWEAAMYSGHHVAVSLEEVVVIPVRSTGSSGHVLELPCYRRCWSRPAHDGIGGARVGAVTVPVRSIAREHEREKGREKSWWHLDAS